MASSIRSMTASSRRSDQGNWGMATWELRSVNHRFLDISIRLPDFLSVIETGIRELIREKLQRGRIDCYLKYKPDPKIGSQFKVDEGLVEQLLKSADVINNKFGALAPIDPFTVLSWPHVLIEEEKNAEIAGTAILALLKTALKDLVAAREREGAALKKVMERLLAATKIETTKIRKRAPKALSYTRAKLISKFAEIKVHLDSGRLEQEMVLFAQKTDIIEELDRLDIHQKEFKRVLNTGGNVGKRLDFLAQELNREANTIAAKSVDAQITQSAIEMKVLFEQIREQIQNLE